MAEISVARHEPGEDAAPLEVTVADEGSETKHRVTVSPGDYERLSRPDETREQFVRRCFEFLLEREPKEAIMSEFDISVISRYFPEFEREIAP